MFGATFNSTRTIVITFVSAMLFLSCFYSPSKTVSYGSIKKKTTEVAQAGPIGTPDGQRVSAEVAAWLRAVKIHLRRSWVVPPAFEMQSLITTIAVDLDAAGNVRGEPSVAQRSGNPWYDENVVRSVKKASPMPPPPKAGRWNFAFPSDGSIKKKSQPTRPVETASTPHERVLPPRSSVGRVTALDETAPVIASPERVEADAASGNATIRGTVKDESEIASFTIDSREVRILSSGGFESRLYIAIGKEEEVELVAIDRYGNRAVQKVTLTRTNRFVVEEIEFEALDPGRSKGGRRQQQALALVIGVEDYKRMPEARYARADANVFRDYAHRALGIPRGRIVSLLDSDADNIGIQGGVRRIQGLVDEKTDLFVYFAGHGFATGKGVPYLLPHDGDARHLGQLTSRNDLFDSLAALGARSVTVFLDTCYSGRGRTGTVLAKGMRPLVIASSNEGVPEGFTVISAAASDEFSGDLPEAEHGLFSYYLMRGLGGEADGNGDRAITVEELHGYIAGEVGRQAARLGREQSPELFGVRDRVLVRY